MSHLRSFNTALRTYHGRIPGPGTGRTPFSNLRPGHPTTPLSPLTPKRTNYNIPIVPADALPNPPDEPEGPPKKKPGSDEEPFRIGPTAFKMFEAALTTFASVGILGAVGYGYTVYYKRMVLSKIEHAFEPGDPVLDLAAVAKQQSTPTGDKELVDDEGHRQHWVLREEQGVIDNIVSGKLKGQYYLLVGEKGTGKSSMLIDAMAKIDGEGCAMLEAHADPEIFRIRLGKALDFEFHEDNIGSLFSIRGPRDASALLDIERSFNKLEKVALKRRDKVGRPLILIINSTHLLRDDVPGRDLLELLQQRAEAWAAGNLMTVIFNSDDYWVYERLKQYATRMNIMPILDLSKPRALEALKNYRSKYKGEIPPTQPILEQVYDMVGGRLSFLARVAKSPDMLKTCEEICRMEKTWFLNKCWILGEEMDDDVMDQQKYASAAMVLAKALVEREKAMERCYDPVKGHILPQMPLHEARQVMTRADFIQDYDSINVFTIDSSAMVRADSVPMMNAFREICAQEGFDEHLEATLERISAIESLGRTRELTIKDLWHKGQYRVKMEDAKGRSSGGLVFEVVPKEGEGEDGDGDGDKKGE
ncbi:hypothetical protein LTR56_016778 [Elasticomyces elasticus]|nr:hypothetical protein LTR22_021783 [Elasticomyces elasticus]KAK3631545.1 hypothetical protein LTR56_016778 [Elasticomyces elasticus]KAK4903044.1 hypothetical protein LTR49_026902 [Elasticomyces elasticus]KAK5737306.1 hypothetical protein LTS12_025921 [Elasticomyces elasticus]